ncbi:hypothetical protein [Oerskovia sp. KBS0722]|uniref:hypothetical protein n=1 Tax=Oerskovia sp. KBS0722 TaxID=1179673 RepID=UPI0011A09441|nr:hypothetical protein [Oerskovia sp. KBS0722]QDW62204.1 hypothetical protein FFI11_006345 [Oerskovia sp. KBS0722]
MIVAALLLGGRGDEVVRPGDADRRDPVTVPVSKAVVLDAEMLSGGVARESVAAVVADDGIVTELRIQSGASVAPRDVIGAVEDIPIVALKVPFPLWRDISEGMRGADVVAVEAALVSVGALPGPGSGVADRQFFDALASLDPRLGNPPLRPHSVAPVGEGGAVLVASGVAVGTKLDDDTFLAIDRAASAIAVSDAGLSAGWVEVGHGIDLFDQDGAQIWSGSVTGVTAGEETTVISVDGPDAVPEKVAGARIVVGTSDGPVLAVPRAAISTRPDGTLSTTVRDGAKETSVTVTTGVCGRDLCEILTSEPVLEVGDLLVVD